MSKPKCIPLYRINLLKTIDKEASTKEIDKFLEKIEKKSKKTDTKQCIN